MIAIEEEKTDVQSDLLRVDVTQEDIDHGFRHSTSHCPIALALRRRGYKMISVGNERISWATQEYEKGGRLSTSRPISSEACEFIESFDSGCRVKPFSFLVEKEPFRDFNVRTWK